MSGIWNGKPPLIEAISATVLVSIPKPKTSQRPRQSTNEAGTALVILGKIILLQ
jgi:hypothetical protein